MSRVEGIFPGIYSILRYKKEFLRGDINSGLTVAVLLVPQAMAYAMLAGLPPITGLYASTFPLFVYAFFGSSRQLAVGPVAIVSIIVFSSLSEVTTPGSPDYINLARLLALMVGCIQIVLWFFRLGFIVNFFSHAVISGFTSAAALIIGFSQIKHLFGIKLPSTHSIFHLIHELFGKISETNIHSLLIGLSAVGVIFFFKRKFPFFPASLFVVVLGVMVVYFFKLHDRGVQIVGDVPRGVPGLNIPNLYDFALIKSLLPPALTIVFVGFMESIAIAKKMAAREKYHINPDYEFRGLAFSNIVSGLFSGYPVTGGFSRTAVNYEAGAKTVLSSVITSIMIILVLLFLTPLFYYLPKSVLASIILVAVAGLVDVKDFKNLIKLDKKDGFLLLFTFVLTLGFGIETGIISGVILSLLFFIWESAHPHIAEVGYWEEEGVLKNVKYYDDVKTRDDVLVIRIDRSIYFANIGFIESYINKAIKDKGEVKSIILDFSAVNDIDGTAIIELDEMIDNYYKRNISVMLANVKTPLKAMLNKKVWQHEMDYELTTKNIAQILKG
ncbi:MAG: sulfate permease [Candidatus Kuenenia sp.]|nr:sulfate permease [Candidatus Kuenenia hertensis]